MIRILLILAGLGLSIGAASAQNTQCSNRPFGDDSNACANTRFVQDAVAAAVPPFANPTASVELTAINGVANTAMRSDSAPALSQAIIPTWTGLHTFTAQAAFTGSISGTITLSAPAIAGINILTLPAATDILVGQNTTDILANKTLTAPRIISGGFIADANGNEQILFTTTAAAVNEITITNAATGNVPVISASGNDTNVGLSLAAKGTGNLSFMPITGQVTIGSLTGYAVNAESGTPFTPTFQIQSTGAGATASITRWSANGNQGRFAFAKSRGAAIGTRGIVADGDSLGTFIFDGDDGANFVTGAVITARVSGTPGTNDMPSSLAFGTTQDGASTPTEWMTLGPTGELRVSDFYMLPNTAVPAGGAAGRGLRMSSTANLGIYFGSGLPTLSAAQGSLYIRTDGSSTSTRFYVNTNGSTGWTNFTSAS